MKYYAVWKFIHALILHFTDWTILDEHFSILCNCLPDDYQSTLVKLKSFSQLSSDDHQQLGAVISSSCEAKLVNEKIVTFLILRLCYNGLRDVMDNLIECDHDQSPAAGCVQQHGKCSTVSKVTWDCMLY